MSITVGAKIVQLPVWHWEKPGLVGEVPFPLPEGWKQIDPAMWLGGADLAFRHPNGLFALVSAMVEQDERRWLHVSISRDDRMPAYEDLCRAKRDLVGRFRKAIQVFAPEDEHVSDHPYCLHLWCCLDDDGLPDFTRGSGTI